MAELVAVGFDDPNDADAVLAELRRLQREYLIDLEDAVVAVRRPDGEVQLKQSVNLVSAGAASGGLWGGLWGSLVGMLFLNPLAGFALGTMVGAGTGALSGKLADYGIDDDFIRQLAQTLRPNTSALFVLVRRPSPTRCWPSCRAFAQGCCARRCRRTRRRGCRRRCRRDPRRLRARALQAARPAAAREAAAREAAARAAVARIGAVRPASRPAAAPAA